jgi:hypothetical protein
MEREVKNINGEQRKKEKLWVRKESTFGSGCVESNGTARQARIANFAVRVDNDLTLFSIISGYFGDT